MSRRQTPKALLDLLVMGRQLETTEIRIQRALRAKFLLQVIKDLNSVEHDSNDSISQLEQLMDKIQPEQPVDCVETEQQTVMNFKTQGSAKSSRLTTLRTTLRTTREWRYVPEKDPTALDLDSLVLRGLLHENLAERLHAMLASSHVICLLREKLLQSKMNDSMKQRLHDIQERLEDDICYFFDQIDKPGTHTTFKFNSPVSLSMRACAESMRQLFPHVSDTVDEGGEGTREERQGEERRGEEKGQRQEAGEITLKRNNTGLKSRSRSRSRSSSSATAPQKNKGSPGPGPLVRLFVLKSISPLASYVKLFGGDATTIKRKRKNDSKDEMDTNRNIQLLMHLLQRARNIARTRLATLRIALGKDHGRIKNNTATSKVSWLNDDETIGRITDTHQTFIHALLNDIYYNETWGLDHVVKNAFAGSLSNIQRATLPQHAALPAADKKKSNEIFFTQEDVMEAHKLAWQLVGDMTAANEVEAAMYAAKQTRTVFESVLADLHAVPKNEIFLMLPTKLMSKIESIGRIQDFLSIGNGNGGPFLLVQHVMFDVLKRYEDIIIEEVTVIETCNIERWEDILKTILSSWKEFVNIINTFVETNVRCHLVVTTTTDVSSVEYFSLFNNTAAAHTKFERDKEELVANIQHNTAAALALVRQLVLTARNVVLPVIHRLVVKVQENMNRLDYNNQNSIHNQKNQYWDNSSSNNEIKFVELSEQYKAEIQQYMKAAVSPIQDDISAALNNSWLMSATMQLCHLYMSQQSTDDYVSCKLQNPTETCLKICMLIKRRTNDLSILLRGENFSRVKKALHRNLLNSIWSHVLTLKFDESGALRLMVDIESYYQVCSIETSAEEQRSARNKGSKTFEMLRTMASLLAVHSGEIENLFPTVVSSTNISPADVLRFVERRNDWHRVHKRIENLVQGIFNVVRNDVEKEVKK